MATLTEIETNWTWEDVIDANSVLDAENAANYVIHKDAEKKANKQRK